MEGLKAMCKLISGLSYNNGSSIGSDNISNTRGRCSGSSSSKHHHQQQHRHQHQRQHEQQQQQQQQQQQEKKQQQLWGDERT